jgi:hypothetical protein
MHQNYPGHNGGHHPVPHHADLTPPGAHPVLPNDTDLTGAGGWPADGGDGSGWESEWIDLGGEG